MHIRLNKTFFYFYRGCTNVACELIDSNLVGSIRELLTNFVK